MSGKLAAIRRPLFPRAVGKPADLMPRLSSIREGSQVWPTRRRRRPVHAGDVGASPLMILHRERASAPRRGPGLPW
jgi:hypothetical protein